MRIAVLSDIHAAAVPFAEALSAARAEGFDRLVLLGDLFTYGVEPRRCADLAAEAIDRDSAVFIAGNHDQLYVDMAEGRSGYGETLPDWIRESVAWTWNELGGRWPDRLDWSEEWAAEDVLFAHANPFGYGDWTYLSDVANLALAAQELARRGFVAGIFGHLHRRACRLSSSGPAVHVVGSVGQPRSRDELCPQWAMVETSREGINVTARPIAFDPAAQRQRIRSTEGLSVATRDKLCRYFA